MITCLQDRRASDLTTRKWLARDWNKRSHSNYPSIYDKGLVLASFLEEMDNANLLSANRSTQFYFLQRCLGVDTSLDIWYEEFIIRDKSLSHRPALMAKRADSPGAPPGPKGQPPLSFANLSIASTTITFWALKIIISHTIATACSAILSSTSRSDPATTLNPIESTSIGLEEESANSSPASSSVVAIAMAQRLLKQYDFAQRKSFATLVTRSMPYCLNFEMGMLGPQRAFFALRTALSTLKSSPSPEQVWVKSVHKILAERYVESTRLAKEYENSSSAIASLLSVALSDNTQYYFIYEFFLAT